MNTDLRCWGIEDELCLTVLLQHGIVAGNDDRTERIPVRGKAQAKDRNIYAESQQCRRQSEQDGCEEDSP
jgi:hypothetical protein